MQKTHPSGVGQGPPASAKQPSRWRRLPTGVAGAVFWLAFGFGLLWLLRLAPNSNPALLGWMQLLVGLALISLAVPLAWRLLHRHLLWSLRNKLILTYILIGLAPVVLFVTFATISAYIAAGQFSIHLADTRLHQQLDELGVESSSRASQLARMMQPRAEQLMGQPPLGPVGPLRRRFRPNNAPGIAEGAAGAASRRSATRAGQTVTPQTASDAAAQAAAQLAAQMAAQSTGQTAALGETTPDPLLARLHPHREVYLNGARIFAARPAGPPPAANGAQPSTVTQTNSAAVQSGPVPENAVGQPVVPLGLPPWAEDLHGNQFRRLVLDGHDLFLVAIDQRHIERGGLLSVVISLPVDSALMDVVAEGLGQVGLYGLMTGGPQTTPVAPANAPDTASINNGRLSLDNDLKRTSVYGGAEPPPAFFFDFEVPFLSTMEIRNWETGLPDNVPIRVYSRPSVLYGQLFGSSLGGIVTSYIRYGLVGLCILFALIEALALWAARRLSRDITASVEDLYVATQRVDRGDFVHRITTAPAGKRDQLGELARSFNRMTGSLERLMVEQQEKERMQSELTIAHEVQANLFPHQVHDLPMLQLHGICRPARTVSGDYYDFLIFRHPDNPDGSRGAESGVGIALGDISGKGISAALLMATLHSAVRAYRLASEDLVYSESAIAALTASRDDLAGDSGKLFESPGRILSLLNRHLFRSTQPEKYATLFLAHYDAATTQLTYSNAGHLPPFVLSRDGKVVRRLDRGGTVVGLMDGIRYEEDRFRMDPGDILVAYSDGITEPENDFGEFGESRLVEIVALYRDQPLAVISNQVLLALGAWIGAAEQPDDITLVLARQL
jgi:sigma-B regulation protein RsbU (phosphoserine phosphatase)